MASSVARPKSYGFFLWGHLKKHFDAVPPRTIENLMERLQASISDNG
jgi:hypothetical protein